MTELDEKRQAANLDILELLEQHLLDYPSLRFNQALYNLGIENTSLTYNEEPEVTLAKMEEALLKISGSEGDQKEGKDENL